MRPLRIDQSGTVPHTAQARAYFSGDEVLMGLHAFTAGYDLYHPHRIVGWHLLRQRIAGDALGRPPRLAPSAPAVAGVMRDLYRGAVAGPARTVTDYEARIGSSLVEGG